MKEAVHKREMSIDTANKIILDKVRADNKEVLRSSAKSKGHGKEVKRLLAQIHMEFEEMN